jgi:glycosyltransferase involved in cell wall biosynthesis
VSFLGKHASILGEPSKDYLHRLFEDVPEIDYFVATDFDYARAINYIKEQNGVVIIASLLDNYPLTVIESITNGFSFIASRAGGIPEMVDESVVFEPTVSSLKDKILALPRISFGQLSHLYDPKLARDIWLSHVTAVIEPAIASPAVIETSSTAVSVCIPFYYADKYLPRLLTGFLRDADPNIQLVIVNDGTPEAECREFHRLKRKLEPIGHIFHSQENGGASRARNKAVELSRHEKLIFFDADNVPLPKMVMKLVNALLAANADSVSAPFFAVPPFIRQPLPTDVYWKYIAPGGPLVAAMLDNQLGDMCGIQRKDVFERLGGFDPNRSYYDDWKYFMKLVGYGYRHYVYPEPLFYYALDPQGRRSTESEYEKRMNLWDGLEAIPKEQLEKVLKVFVKDAYVKRPQQ